MPHRKSIAALLTLMRERESFVISSHARPDGDAIGSSLGLMHVLEAMGKRVHVAFSDPIPQIYKSLPGVERIRTRLPDTPCDAIILLECESFARTGFDEAAFARLAAGLSINIDHHRSGQLFASFNWIDPEACAVGAMIYDLAIASGVEISASMATCLYTAVLTDSGAFTYPSTVSATFALAEHLVRSGADANGIAQAVYFSNPPGKIRLLGAALRNMQIQEPLAWAWILQDGAEVEDCEGVVNYLIGMAGIEAAVFMRELPSGKDFRLSLRSKGEVDVASVAEHFGGGGHRNASGCNLEGDLDTVLAHILPALRSSCDPTPAAGK